MGVRRSDGDGDDVKEGGSQDQYGKKKVNGLYSRLHLGGVEQRGVQTPGDGGRENFQG